MSNRRSIYLLAILVSLSVVIVGLTDKQSVPKLLASAGDQQRGEMAGQAQAFFPFVSKPMVINTTADGVDWNPGDGRCETAPGNNVCTLRGIIQEMNAQPGPDTIFVPVGQYVLTLTGVDEDNAATGDLDIVDELTIIGQHPTDTVIDGNQTDRVFHSVGTEVLMMNLTITNGKASGDYGGGGIYNGRDPDYIPGKLTLENVRINYNTATGLGGGNVGGGGIKSEGPLTITYSIISNNETVNGSGGGIQSAGTLSTFETMVQYNTAARSGGGIAAERIVTMNTAVIANTIREGGPISEGAGLHVTISALIEGSGISYNTLSSGQGGGIFISGNATATINRVIVAYNAATTTSGNTGTRGGGIYSESNQVVTITDTTIQANTSGSSGGGIYTSQGSTGQMVLNRVTLRENVADAFGAAIYNGSTMYLTNVTVSGNRAVGMGNQVGGGIYNTGPLLLLTNSTVAFNEARYSGAIYQSSGNVTLENTILANNIATGPIAPGDPNTHNCSGSIASAGHNLDDGVDCNFNAIGDLSGVDPLLLPLTIAYNLTDVHPIYTGSPAIDSGSNVNCPPIDQRFVVRPVDGDGDGNAVCDIGSFEYSISGAGTQPEMDRGF